MRCLNCFGEYDESFGMCPHCGSATVEAKEPIDLAPGTILAQRYLIGQSVGSGGFGIIYKAFDLKLESIVAVKEYYPSRLVARAMGTPSVIVNNKTIEEFLYRKGRFIAEARNMAKFGAHRNIPNVFEFFEENNTAYIVMELLVGTPLNDYLRGVSGPIDQDFAIYIANEVGNALSSMHSEGIIHRDVAPDNIYIGSDKDIKVKLLDLGAAKLADVEEDVIDIVLKPGYSPIEQYVDDDKGNRKTIDERTDIYALGATLYIMLTGVKPDESTNRRINDEVLPPNAIVPSISENLSNSVMKAMAIDKHLRFKTVKEFLQAINGNKKVVSLKKDKRRRKIKQIAGVVAALLIVAGAAFVLNNYYNSKRLEYDLNPVSISVWYVDDASNNAAMESIKKDFESTYEGVTLELRAIDEASYVDEIALASQNGSMPTLFDSTLLPDEMLTDCANLNPVVSSEPAQACLFLDSYSKCYPDAKQVPLSVEIPVACVITNGPTCVDYVADYYTDVSSFPQGTMVSVDSENSFVVSQNYDVSNLSSDVMFMGLRENVSPVLLTTTVGMDHVRQLIPNVQYKFVYPNSNPVVCRFTSEWSISVTKGDEYAAAERLLSWMLGNKYQSDLFINYGVTGEFPICQQTFETMIATSNYYEPISNIYTKFEFIQYDPEAFEVQTAAPLPLTAQEEFVFKAVYHLYGREASRSEINEMLNQISSIGGSEFIWELSHSEEMVNRGLTTEDFIRAFYLATFGRNVDSEGLNNWANVINSEGSNDSLILGVVCSDEWKNVCSRYGFLSDVNPSHFPAEDIPQ